MCLFVSNACVRLSVLIALCLSTTPFASHNILPSISRADTIVWHSSPLLCCSMLLVDPWHHWSAPLDALTTHSPHHIVPGAARNASQKPISIHTFINVKIDIKYLTIIDTIMQWDLSVVFRTTTATKTTTSKRSSPLWEWFSSFSSFLRFPTLFIDERKWRHCHCELIKSRMLLLLLLIHCMMLVTPAYFLRWTLNLNGIDLWFQVMTTIRIVVTATTMRKKAVTHLQVLVSEIPNEHFLISIELPVIIYVEGKSNHQIYHVRWQFDHIVREGIHLQHRHTRQPYGNCRKLILIQTNYFGVSIFKKGKCCDWFMFTQHNKQTNKQIWLCIIEKSDTLYCMIMSLSIWGRQFNENRINSNEDAIPSYRL